MSFLVTRPSLPVPLILFSSSTEIPSADAIFFTNGEKNLSESEKSGTKFKSVLTVEICSSMAFAVTGTSATDELPTGSALVPSVSIIAMVCPT